MPPESRVVDLAATAHVLVVVLNGVVTAPAQSPRTSLAILLKGLLGSATFRMTPADDILSAVVAACAYATVRRVARRGLPNACRGRLPTVQPGGRGLASGDSDGDRSGAPHGHDPITSACRARAGRFRQAFRQVPLFILGVNTHGTSRAPGSKSLQFLAPPLAWPGSRAHQLVGGDRGWPSASLPVRPRAAVPAPDLPR
jgi:hypothetical protein